MLRSFQEISKRKDELSDLIRDVFGEQCVGSFGVSINPTPIVRSKRKRRHLVESDGTSDESGPERVTSGIVKDILIEAQTLPAGEGGRNVYLTTWEGHGDLECAWVRESGMSKATKDWWSLEHELRYPGYCANDYPLYDAKQNSLCLSASSREFLLALPLSLLQSSTPEITFMELVASPEFIAWNFVLAVFGEVSLELFFRITETLVDGDGKLNTDERISSSGTPSNYPARPLRLIVSSSSSDEEKMEKSKDGLSVTEANRLTSSVRSEVSEFCAVELSIT